MNRENPLWGAPRIHGELLKLGLDIGEISVSKYMVRRRNPPSQTWRTFLANHVNDPGSLDFFTVPTIRFQVPYVFLVLAHDRRRIVYVNVTALPRPNGLASSSGTRFPGAACHVISSMIVTASLAPRLKRICMPWESRKCCQRRDRRGSRRTSSA
jgi:hypothetical protein